MEHKFPLVRENNSRKTSILLEVLLIPHVELFNVQVIKGTTRFYSFVDTSLHNVHIDTCCAFLRKRVSLEKYNISRAKANPRENKNFFPIYIYIYIYISR